MKLASVFKNNGNALPEKLPLYLGVGIGSLCVPLVEGTGKRVSETVQLFIGISPMDSLPETYLRK